ncbi:hypothetical protein O6P43_004533 [Quillaja saponaria]|uniref:Uncharacterized protein n=1 Tax=Quillaja saponaria TaxID=32244 RepID=A0AAD7VFZ0_QUISA|nr:hypothetical protein O6P43_004533 [Quillaja saponaria]
MTPFATSYLEPILFIYKAAAVISPRLKPLQFLQTHLISESTLFKALASQLLGSNLILLLLSDNIFNPLRRYLTCRIPLSRENMHPRLYKSMNKNKKLKEEDGEESRTTNLLV